METIIAPDLLFAKIMTYYKHNNLEVDVMDAPTIQYDHATGKIVELVPTELVEDSFQERLDEAQNRLNTANEAVPVKEAEYAEVVAAVELKSQELESARKEVAAATEEVAFQVVRKAQWDEAVRLRDEVAIASPESEFAGDESEAVAVEVHVAEQAPA